MKVKPGRTLIHHTVPPAVVPPCGVWLIRPQSSRLFALHPAPSEGQGGAATHGPHAIVVLKIPFRFNF